jgi:predicted acylesterase/phospholipase RssA
MQQHNYKEIVYDLAGGGTIGAAYAGQISELIKAGLLPSKIIAVSVTAVQGIAIALAAHNEEWRHKLLEYSRNLVLKDFFDVSPVNKKGKLSWAAIMRLIAGKTSLGVQNTGKLLDKLIGEEGYNIYKKDPNTAPVYVAAVDYDTRKLVLINLKDKNKTWKQVKNDIEKSSVIPFWVQGVEDVDEEGVARLYYDGGVTDQNAGNTAKDLLIGADLVVYSCARPSKSFKIDRPKNAINVLEWFIATRNMHGATMDLYKLKKICKEIGAEILELFVYLDKIEPYNTNKEYLHRIQKEAEHNARERIKEFLK